MSRCLIGLCNCTMRIRRRQQNASLGLTFCPSLVTSEIMSKTRNSTAPTNRSRTTRKTSDAVEIIRHRLLRKDAAFAAMVEEATLNAHVAKLIYDAPSAAGMTQKAL